MARPMCPHRPCCFLREHLASVQGARPLSQVPEAGQPCEPVGHAVGPDAPEGTNLILTEQQPARSSGDLPGRPP